MPKANFCEDQLKQWMNTEICFRTGLFPMICSQRIENLVGWDSAFFFPSLGNAGPNGCNLFIQYKISNRYDTKRAQGWDRWNKSFFRFDLWHQKFSGHDFTQRDQLIKLAQSGYAAIYVTNHVIDISNLLQLARQHQLCSSLPVLRINQTLSQHERVSFSSNSTHFYLHSDEEQIARTSVEEVLKGIEPTNLHDDIAKITELLTDYEVSVGIKKRTLKEELMKVGKMKVNIDMKRVNEFFHSYSEALIIKDFLRYYLNVHWLRFARRIYEGE